MSTITFIAFPLLLERSYGTAARTALLRTLVLGVFWLLGNEMATPRTLTKLGNVTYLTDSFEHSLFLEKSESGGVRPGHEGPEPVTKGQNQVTNGWSHEQLAQP